MGGVCKACGEKMSRMALKCPECGASVINPMFYRYWQLIVFIVLVLIAALALFFFLRSSEPSPEETTKTYIQEVVSFLKC
jgi:membrane protein implicated in regulation of membrane protease activity